MQTSRDGDGNGKDSIGEELDRYGHLRYREQGVELGFNQANFIGSK